MSKLEIELQDTIELLERCNQTQGEKLKELKSKLFYQDRTIQALLSQIKGYREIIEHKNKELKDLRSE